MATKYRLGNPEVLPHVLEFGTKGKGADEKAKRIADFRKEASRLSSMANKRIERLERNNLTDTPAYKRYVESGGAKFGVKGKSFNEVQAEMARLNKFITSESSTIKGVNNVLKTMAANTGIKYKNLTELRAKSSKFFELSSKVEQYLRTVDDMASAIGYQKIWEAINEYTKKAHVDLADGETDIDSMIEDITNAIKEYDSPIQDETNVSNLKVNWYIVKD